MAESKILPWAKDVMARDYRPRLKAVQRGKAADPGENIDALDERRARVLQMFADGDIDRIEKKRRLAAIDAQMPALELGRRAVSVLSDGGLILSACPPAGHQNRSPESSQRLPRSLQLWPPSLRPFSL